MFVYTCIDCLWCVVLVDSCLFCVFIACVGLCLVVLGLLVLCLGWLFGGLYCDLLRCDVACRVNYADCLVV